jgi:hypothetical protein
MRLPEHKRKRLRRRTVNMMPGNIGPMPAVVKSTQWGRPALYHYHSVRGEALQRVLGPRDHGPTGDEGGRSLRGTGRDPADALPPCGPGWLLASG